MATILIVDDRPANRQFLLSLLGHTGHRLIEASDGLAALEVARAARPDLVITDVLMPKIDGYELVRRMRADAGLARSRVIFMTAAYLEAEARELARACGVKHFVLKPAEPEALLELVGAVLAEQPPTETTKFDGEILDGHLRLLTDKLHRYVIELEQANSELDRRVAERTAQLEAANRELEAFSYSVSHDLRAPVRHIGGFARLLMENPEPLGETSARYLKIIAEAAHHMGELIDGLLALSHVGRAELRRQRVDMAGLVQEARRQIGPDAALPSVRWTIGALPAVGGDPALLRLVWTNLLSNALKYSSRREEQRIEIGSREGAAGEVVFFVRDNGAGFDMKYKDKLFKVFQRLHRADEFKGTGVGLATVRRIVERHGGQVWAEGSPQEGATFSFSIKAEKRTAAGA